jgi:putative flippase GtrA
MLPQAQTRRELFRYAAIGVTVNALLYAGYLLLSAHGIGHKVAMTLMYATGTACSFVGNRRWTFDHRGGVSAALVRYMVTYALAYGLNLVTLMLLVDAAGLPHRWVMAALIAVSAGLIFLAQKYWVFRSHAALTV